MTEDSSEKTQKDKAQRRDWYDDWTMSGYADSTPPPNLNPNKMTPAMMSDVMENTYAKIGYKLNLLLTTGQVLMENGADTHRIMLTMIRVAEYMGIHWDKVNLHIAYTTLMLNVSDDDHSFTCFRKCRKHVMDLEAIADIGRLSWHALEDGYTLWQYDEALQEIASRGVCYSPVKMAIGAGIATGGFCLLFGSDWVAFFFCLICSAVGFMARKLCDDLEINKFIAIAVGSFTATILSYFTHLIPWSITPWHPMIACSLFLFPGIPLMNSINDFLNEHIISGITRAMMGVLIAGGLTLGVVTALESVVLTNAFFSSIVIVPAHTNLFHYSIAGGLAAIGFAIIFNIPPKILPYVAIGGMISSTVRIVTTNICGVSMPLGSFLGAGAVTIIAMITARHIQFPTRMLVIPSIIPMIPGVLLYRLLFAVINIKDLNLDSLLKAFSNGVMAILILVGLAVGASLPYIFASKYLDRAKWNRYSCLLKQFHSHWKV